MEFLFFGFTSQIVKADTVTADNTSGSINHQVTPAATTDISKNTPHNNPSDDSDTWQIGSDNSKVYNGKETTKIDASCFSMSDGDQKISVNNDSFQWVDKDGKPVVETPKNVGTYTVTQGYC